MDLTLKKLPMENGVKNTTFLVREALNSLQLEQGETEPEWFLPIAIFDLQTQGLLGHSKKFENQVLEGKAIEKITRYLITQLHWAGTLESNIGFLDRTLASTEIGIDTYFTLINLPLSAKNKVNPNGEYRIGVVIADSQHTTRLDQEPILLKSVLLTRISFFLTGLSFLRKSDDLMTNATVANPPLIQQLTDLVISAKHKPSLSTEVRILKPG